MLLSHIQLFDKPAFNDNGGRWVPSLRTEKIFFIVILPALHGSHVREQQPALSFIANRPICTCIGAFVRRLRRFPRSDPFGACHTHPYAMAARNDDAVYGFWMDLEQDVDHQS